jgi:hypothetical protein
MRLSKGSVSFAFSHEERVFLFRPGITNAAENQGIGGS